jgi:hypothetical protein
MPETPESRRAAEAQQGLKLLHAFQDRLEMQSIMSKSLGRKVILKTTKGDFTSGTKPRKAAPPYSQPSRTPIQIPKQFSGDYTKSDMFRLAVHEVSHALGNLLFTGGVDGVLLTSLDEGGVGKSYGLNGTGEDAARVALAGLAGERLVAGDPLSIEGFAVDVESAWEHMREIGTLENEIGDKLAAMYKHLQATFSTSWTAALREGATQLTRRGVLSGEQLWEIFADSQKAAADAGTTFAKAYSCVSFGLGSAAPHVDTVTFRKQRIQVRSN